MKAIKQHFISLFIFLALLLSSTAVFAQETATTTSVESTSTEEVETTSDSTETNADDATERDRQSERQQTQEEQREALQNSQAEREAEREERRAEVQENIAERRETLQENQEERQAALSEQARNRIINLAANISNRLDAATDRMQSIIKRIGSRIEKLQARGVDTNEAERHLADAQAAIDAAKLQLSNIDTVVSETVTAENPRSAWQRAKTEYLTIKEHIISAHTSLRSSVAALKTAIDEAQNTPPEDTETPE